MARKLIIDTPAGREIFELFDTSTQVGRDEGCQLKLEGDRVSRRHCRFLLVDGQLLVEDLGSSNGTFVDGERLADRKLLSGGDKVEIGDNVVWVDRAPTVGAAPVTDAEDDDDFAEGRSAPPASRRQAGDRKARSNTLPIVASIAALLLIVFVMKKQSAERDGAPTREANERAIAERMERAEREAGRDDSEGSPNSVVAPPIDPATMAEQTARARGVEELDFEIEQHLIQDDFAGAQAAIASFEKRHGNAPISIRKSLEDAVRKAFEGSVAEYQRMLTEGKEEVALTKLRESIGRFPAGSEARDDLERILRRGADGPLVDRNESMPARRETARTPKAPIRSPVLAPRAKDPADREAAQDRFFALGNEAEILLGQRRYDQSALRFRKAAESGVSAGLERGLIAPIERKMRQAERLRDFVVVLAEQAGENPESFGQVPFLAGRRGAVKGSGEQGIIFADDEGEIVISPRILRSDAMVAMIKKAELSGVDRTNAAAWLFTVGEREQAEKLLYRAERESAALKPEIDSILADAFAIDLPEGGFVWHDGHYLSPGDVSRVKVREAIEAALPDLASNEAVKRSAAYASLRALGDRAASAYQRALLDAKAGLLERASKMAGYAKLAALDESRDQLEKSREHALSLIFDEVAYPYPYRGRGPEVMKRYQETQQEVDRRVAVVREIWESKLKVKVSKDLRQVVAILAEYNRELDRLELGRGPDDPRFLLHLPATGAVDIRNYAWSYEERERIDVSQDWMQENATKDSKASAPERDQVQVTNEYRMMMGRHAVKLHEKLLDCARMHSTDMANGGFFSHDNPLDPKKRTPRDRATLVGYEGVGISENIAVNGGGAVGAHNAWVHSSGHHRNILSAAWRLLGSGNNGRYWTQNFSIREHGTGEGTTGVTGGDSTPEGDGEDGVR